MSAVIISILVNLLGAFLTALFKKWFGVKQGAQSQSELIGALYEAKAEFLSKIKWRIWLGPNREQWASLLYDRAQNRLSGSMLELSANAGELATFCTDGLQKLTPEELAPKRSLGPGAHRYKLLPNGLVKGGSAAYTCDAEGNIIYEASIIAGKWFLTKTYDFHGSYKADPALLEPANLRVGDVIRVGQLRMRVASIGQSTAMVSLTLKNGIGAATLSTDLQLILVSMDATISVSGFQVTLGLRQV